MLPANRQDAPEPPEASSQTLLPRNGRCPCGSGAKYKRCCGVNAPPVDGAARSAQTQARFRADAPGGPVF